MDLTPEQQKILNEIREAVMEAGDKILKDRAPITLDRFLDPKYLAIREELFPHLKN